MSTKSSSSPDSPLKPLIQRHFTPPHYYKIKNPFEKALLDNLHRPICSPDMFVPSQKDSNAQFEWDINEVAILKPADIDDSPGQSDPSPDPTLEKKANTVIKKFFSKGVLPSPMDQPPRVIALMKSQNDNARRYTLSSTKEAQTQTALSLPPVLPKDVELLLAPYFTDTANESSNNFHNTPGSSYYLWYASTISREEECNQQSRKEPLVQRNNVLIHGMERTFGTPTFGTPAKLNSVKPQNATIQRCNLLEQTPDLGFSPILYEQYTSNGSLPDHLSPINFENEERVTASDIKSCKDDKAHFCGSTPEKSIVTTYHTSLSPVRIKQRGGTLSFTGKLQKGESNLNKSKSAMKLDFSMDMSVDTSLTSNLDKSLRSHSNPGLPLDSCQSSLLAKQEVWKMDVSNCEHLSSKQGDTAHDNNPAEYKFVKPDNVEFLFEEKNSKNIGTKSSDDHHYEIKDTPIKGKAKNVLLLDKVFERVFQEKKSFNQNMESPLQMSFDNSFDTDQLENLPEANADLKSASFSSLITSQINIRSCVKPHNTNDVSVKSICDNSTAYKRLDSGLGNETSYFSKSSYLDNVTRQSGELIYADLTKSHCNVDLAKSSAENWRRLDSGFTDETSTDNFQYYSDEQKENILPNQESFSMSDIFANGIINCDFSSTPSKSKIRKN